MTNKIGIGIAANLDTTAVEAQLNTLLQKIGELNKVKFTPFSGTSVAEVDAMIAKFEQLKRLNGDLNTRLQKTGQSKASLTGTNWAEVYEDDNLRAKKLKEIIKHTTGRKPEPESGAVNSGQNKGKMHYPGGGGRKGEASLGGAAAGVAQAGLRAAGPVGGVAANAMGTGMAAGMGAGLMGLMGGMAALAVGKVVGAVAEKMDVSKANDAGIDKLKRALGDVNVSFNALNAVVKGAGNNLKVSYEEAGRLSTQFVKLGNLAGADYKTLGDELNTGIGLSRSYGLDPSAGVGVLGSARGLGQTKNTQESRQLAIVIGETITKAGAFAKADEVMDAMSTYMTTQTRVSMGRANMAGYGDALGAMVKTGLPGMDVAGASSLLAQVNASLMMGGAKGEASQFLTGSIGTSMGLNPYQTRYYREGGAFATADNSFGDGSLYEQFSGKKGAAKGGVNFLRQTIGRVEQGYGKGTDEAADALANHLKLTMAQSMGLMIANKYMGEELGSLAEYGDLSQMSGTGIANMAMAKKGTDADRAGIAQSLLGREDVKKEDKDKIKAFEGKPDSQEYRNLLAQLSAKHGQEQNQATVTRDIKAILDNMQVDVASKLIPLTNDIKLGIIHLAGGGKKSPNQIMKEVLELEGQDKLNSVTGQFKTERDDMINKRAAKEKEKETLSKGLTLAMRDMSPEEIKQAQAKINTHVEPWDEFKAKLDQLNDEEIKLKTQINTETTKKLKNLAMPLEVPTSGAAFAPKFGEAPAVVSGGGHQSTAVVNASNSRYKVKTNDARTMAEYDARFLMGLGLPETQATAMAASNWGESGVGGINGHQAVGDGGKAYGISQWHPDRQEEFRKFIGHDIKTSTRDEQLRFQAHEITQGTESKKNGAFFAASNVADATKAFVTNHIRPADKPGQSRIRGDFARGLTPMSDAEFAKMQGTSTAGTNITADEITVRIVDGNNKPVAPSQAIALKVSPTKPFGGTG